MANDAATGLEIWLEEKTDEVMKQIAMPTAAMQDAIRALVKSTLRVAYWKGKRDGLDACEKILDSTIAK